MLFVAIWEQPWENVQQFNVKRKAWYAKIKPDTIKVLGAYSLQGPTAKGVTLFETDRVEDVNLYRNYYALAGANIDIRPAIEFEKSVDVVETLMARW